MISGKSILWRLLGKRKRKAAQRKIGFWARGYYVLGGLALLVFIPLFSIGLSSHLIQVTEKKQPAPKAAPKKEHHAKKEGIFLERFKDIDIDKYQPEKPKEAPPTITLTPTAEERREKFSWRGEICERFYDVECVPFPLWLSDEEIKTGYSDNPLICKHYPEIICLD